MAVAGLDPGKLLQTELLKFSIPPIGCVIRGNSSRVELGFKIRQQALQLGGSFHGMK
jgi:hypothetical protein